MSVVLSKQEDACNLFALNSLSLGKFRKYLLRTLEKRKEIEG